MRRKKAATFEWPERLGTCVLEDWAMPDDPTNEVGRIVTCWTRWVEARFDHLRSLGWTRDAAQYDAVGPFPLSTVPASRSRRHHV